MMLVLLVGLFLGWGSSVRRARRHANHLQYAERELQRARDQLRDRDRAKQQDSREVWQVELDGASLRGVTISSPGNALQRASFRHCDLEDAILTGGASAFQLACFDNANLVNSRLTGGGASFQLATFVGADLTGATLTGGGSSFQIASFENARLVQAKLAGSFGSVNISGAHFEGADLSALDSESLASCYFKEPPTYDKRTRFPSGFDPQAQDWRRVPE